MIVQLNHDKTKLRMTLRTTHAEDVTVELEPKDARTLQEALNILVPELFPVRDWIITVKGCGHRRIAMVIQARTSVEACQKAVLSGWTVLNVEGRTQ